MTSRFRLRQKFAGTIKNRRRPAQLSLSTIPTLAALVIRTTAPLAMLTLGPFSFVSFAAVVLVPPATVPVMLFDATRNCQQPYRDRGKTQASHTLPPIVREKTDSSDHHRNGRPGSAASFFITNGKARKKIAGTLRRCSASHDLI